MRGSCGRQCCWRGPAGRCEPVDPMACRCHVDPPLKEMILALLGGDKQTQEQTA